MKNWLSHAAWIRVIRAIRGSSLRLILQFE
jgi:hypothetical protein